MIGSLWLARRTTAVGSALLVLAVIVAPARASDVAEQEGLSIGPSIEAGAGYFHTDDPNFGLGRIDLRTGRNTGDARWGEGYLEPRLDLSYGSEGAGTIYGAGSLVATITRGGGDAGGFTANEESIGIEQLHAGWRSGALLPGLLDQGALDLSAGRQDFRIGDGFLIWDGNFDAGTDGAYWLAPRSAFDLTGIARLNAAPVGAQLFYLRGDEHQGRAELVGGNLDLPIDLGTLGASYFQIVDTSPGFDALLPRDGMEVVSVRLNELSPPGLDDMSLHAEYVRQFGRGPNARFSAHAFYVEPAYTLSGLAWTPRLAYRFAYFSGDPDPADNWREDFDPLFYGSSRGWGTWFQGEITGEYLLFNSNQVNHMLHLSAAPAEEVGIGAILYRFDLAERNYFGVPVESRRFADELNLYADWTVSENLLLGAVYGMAVPHQAARETFGNSTFQLFQVFATVSF